MAINIGTKTHQAAAKLRGNPDFTDLMEGLGDLAQSYMHAAAKSTPELRVDSTAHARGLFDIWESLEAARIDANPRAIKPPRMTANNGALAHA